MPYRRTAGLIAIERTELIQHRLGLLRPEQEAHYRAGGLYTSCVGQLGTSRSSGRVRRHFLPCPGDRRYRDQHG